MSVAITAQAPVASLPPTDSPQAAQGPGAGTGATSEQGLADFFAKAHVDAANGNLQEATNSVASSGEMLGKLREFVEKAHQGDAANRATEPGRGPPPPRRRLNLAASTRLAPSASLTPSPNFTRPASPAHSVRLVRSMGIPPAVCLRDRRRNRSVLTCRAKAAYPPWLTR